MNSDVISELHVFFVHPDGTKVLGRIWIGRPHVIDTGAFAQLRTSADTR
jgi:hypothetical protein